MSYQKLLPNFPEKIRYAPKLNYKIKYKNYNRLI